MRGRRVGEADVHLAVLRDVSTLARVGVAEEREDESLGRARRHRSRVEQPRAAVRGEHRELPARQCKTVTSVVCSPDLASLHDLVQLVHLGRERGLVRRLLNVGILVRHDGRWRGRSRNSSSSLRFVDCLGSACRISHFASAACRTAVKLRIGSDLVSNVSLLPSVHVSQRRPGLARQDAVCVVDRARAGQIRAGAGPADARSRTRTSRYCPSRSQSRAG